MSDKRGDLALIFMCRSRRSRSKNKGAALVKECGALTF